MARAKLIMKHTGDMHEVRCQVEHHGLRRCLNQLGLVSAIVLVLASCGTLDKDQPPSSAPKGLFGQTPPEADATAGARSVAGLETENRRGASVSVQALEQLSPIADSIRPALSEPEFYRGTGMLARPLLRPKSGVEIAKNGDVTLNFANAEIQEVADVVLGQTLKVNYIIDPKVKGQVTARTSQPIPREMVIPALENILAMSGAALTRTDGIYKVIPLKDAATGITAPIFDPSHTQFAQGFGIHVIPVKFASAAALHDILNPFVGSGRMLRVDAARNLLIFSGTGPEAFDLMALVAIFDVDWMAGMSFALFPLKVATAKQLVPELETVFLQDGASPLAGMVKFVPIGRLNAILAISPQAAYLDRAKTWIERLDRGTEGEGRRIFVYRVQNGRATDLAEVLRQIFEVDVTKESEGPGEFLAAGLTPVTIASSTQASAADSQGASGQAEDAAPARESAEQSPAVPRRSYERSKPSRSGSRGRDVIETVDQVGNIRIIADDVKNSLVILATPAEYRMIQSTLTELDFMPLQVLIEATIAEVTLNDNLQYGLQWFFNLDKDGIKHDIGFSALGSGAVAAAFPGFSYLFSATDVRGVLNALSEITTVKVISSPQLMVLDNQTARLQVGDQVPIATQSAVSVTDPDAPVVNSIQFRDTGIILEVTPRVNAGGLVLLDVLQEVSDVVPTTTSQLNSPTIQQRSIHTTVAVQSGDFIALGGLIRETNSEATSGVPVLSAIPILGNLFKTTTETVVRTELLILIHPRVIRNRSEARDVTRELRKRMSSLNQLNWNLGPSD